MYQLLNKYGQLFAFGLGLLITIVFLIFAISGLDGFNALPEEEQGTTSIFNFGLISAVFLILVCVVVILGFGLYHTISNPKSSIKFLIGIGAIIVIFGIAYAMSNSETSGSLYTLMQEEQISERTSKFISGALWSAVGLAIIAAGTFVVSEFRNLFK